MKRMGGWLGTKSTNASSKSLTALDEPQALRDALAGAAHILNDDVDLAEAELSKGTSPFHKLGLATTSFLRATLGIEKEVIEQASQRLAEAGEAALDHQKRAIRDPSTAHQSAIYPVGSEYALIHAETQLMSAVVAVLNESLTESLKGFYKLRKASQTLYEISEAEQRYVRGKSTSSLGSSSKSSASSSGVRTPSSLGEAHDSDEDLEFVDADDGLDRPRPVEYQGHLNGSDLSRLELQDTATAKPIDNPPGVSVNSRAAADSAEDELDFRTVTTHPVDLFIHSGTALCYGLLQLMLSMIPPAFAKLLSIFSFRGDRVNGLRLLWSATNFKQNINGGMAGLITLGFHNGAIAVCDILTTDALPEARLRKLLREMRQLYPKSKLWLLEEARMLSADHELEKAVELMDSGDKSPLKQVEALRVFEKSLNLMYLHKYQECADSFIKCIHLNNWSHGLYYYIAGACYVELYRIAKVNDPETAKKYGTKATELLRTVPQHTGKKRFMARQLPFDTFVLRKMTKWEERSKQLSIDLVDAVGVSPLEEMTYFWSGYRRMPPKQLELSLERLAWSEDTSLNSQWADEASDEKAILRLLRGTCQRFLGHIAEAKATFTDGVLCYELPHVKTFPHPDTWTLPVAHYEMAVCLWEEAGGGGGDRATLQRCSEWLAKVEKWEGFDLEARLGLKVTTARETLRRCGVS